ncbi:hypothetical protein Agub_g14169 [Astrephomene gubernaculifera]|uniref:BTB domain-containing protein n=1 Tax=Astrephomene gubernaculifera TaxID=47775 RepID=A0AAD3E5A1_9CHLO|nr:hypothetical protein Agub_g14169 [Astrephomene gubernaculifera]
MVETSANLDNLEKVSLPVPFPVAIVTRPHPGISGSPNCNYQTLVFSNERDALFSSGSGARSCIFELLGDGSDPSAPFRLAALALELKERSPDGRLVPYTCQVALHRAVYDSYSKAVYFVEGRALMRLGSDDVVAPLAGHRELCGANDGPGGAARFQLPHSLAADGAGSLFVADCGTVRRVVLPGLHEREGAEAVVTTLYGGPWSAGFVDVAYESTTGRLYAATISAVYRLSDEGRVITRVAGCEAASGSGSAAASNWGGGNGLPAPAAAAAVPAGAAPEGAAAATSAGSAAGGGSGAGQFQGFGGISGLVADVDGGLLVADRQHVYRLEADGGVASVICVGKSDTSWGAVGCYPCILPNGWLALCQYHDRRLLLLHLGLQPAPAPQRAVWHEGVSGLLGDLAALLACPDGSEDVEVAVGGACFRCHRVILAARCAYFRRLFAGSFADSRARKVVLQDADPDAFSHLLRHMYTGDLSFPLASLRAVAELADRLLLHQVVRHVHRRLLAAAQPEGVVADMLWAQRQGFTDLLASLKEWYLEHQTQVLAAAPDSVRELFVAAPALMYDLHCATVRQAQQQQRK